MNKTIFLILFIFTAFSLSTYSITIKGRAINEKNEPVDAANVTLLSGDSIPLANTITDKKGLFEINLSGQGDFLLVLSAIGYQQSFTAIKGIGTNLDIGDLLLKESSYELSEVFVTGEKIIRKIDRQIIFPTQAQIEASTDGLNLLSKMSPNHLRINSAKETVTFGASGTVRLQINGMNTDMKEILALQPAQILRIEYYDNPGLQFGEDQPDAVLNYIVKRTQGGGVVAANLLNALNTGFGSDRITTKLNYKESEFAFNYFFFYEHYKDRWSDRTTIYRYPDKELEQNIDGIKKPYGDIRHNINLAYNLLHSGKYMFNAKLDLFLQNWDNSFANIQTFVQSPEIRKVADSQNKTKSYAPSIDLYYIRYLGRQQQITANLVGTYFHTDYHRKYQENEGDVRISDFRNSINGKKYSAIAEVAYRKSWDHIALDLGGSYKHTYVNNNYVNTTEQNVRINKSHLYAYAQLSGNIKKWEFILGVAGKRSYFSDSENSYRFSGFLPKLKIKYNLSGQLSIAASGEIYTMDPPPGYLSDVSQQIDYFTIQKGNPNLQPYKGYKSRLGIEFSKGIFSLTAYARYDYFNKPITADILYENNSFINSFLNQKYYNYLGGFIDFNFEFIKDRLYLYWTNAINHERTAGFDYKHKLTTFDIGASLSYYYKRWDFMIYVYKRTKSLWGEVISINFPNENISIGYKINNIRLGVGVNTPFHDKWNASRENLSRLNPSKGWTYMGAASPFVYLTFSWNISWGKKYESKGKELHNQDTDAGILNVKDK